MIPNQNKITLPERAGLIRFNKCKSRPSRYWGRVIIMQKSEQSGKRI